jgi:hypothetical protein
MKIAAPEIGFKLVTFSKKYFDLYFNAWIVANSQLQDASIKPVCRVCSQKLKFL